MVKDIDFLNFSLTVSQPNGYTVFDGTLSLHTYEVDLLYKVCHFPFFQDFCNESLYRIMISYANYCKKYSVPIKTTFLLDDCVCSLSISISYKK